MHNPIPQLQRAPLPGPVTWYEPARPTCRKTWFGTLRCNYEARYDVEAADLSQFKSINAGPGQLEALRRRQYVHDICTACGHIVKRERDAP